MDEQREKRLVACREYYLRTKEKKREYNLKHLYNITIDEYNDMFSFQDGKCAGCKTHQSDMRKALHVDHCHPTGKNTRITLP